MTRLFPRNLLRFNLKIAVHDQVVACATREQIFGVTSGTAAVPGSAELALERGFVLVPVPPHLGGLWPGWQGGWVALPRGGRQEQLEAALQEQQSRHRHGAQLCSAVPRL